jgi:ABC-type transporter Mla subunit MlaD
MSIIVFRGTKYVPLVRTALRARKSPKPAIDRTKKVALKYYQSAQYAAQKLPNMVADKLDEINTAFVKYYDENPEEFPTILEALKQNSQALKEASQRMGPLAQQADDLWDRVVRVRQQWEQKGADPRLLDELDEIGQILFYGSQ